MSELPILIIGGAGKTGARVDAPLQSRGMPTRPVSRSTPVPFDWTRPETWPAALAGDYARRTAATGVWRA